MCKNKAFIVIWNHGDLFYNFVGGESIKVNESLFQDMEELDTEIDSLGLDDDEDIYLGENSLDDDWKWCADKIDIGRRALVDTL